MAEQEFLTRSFFMRGPYAKSLCSETGEFLAAEKVCSCWEHRAKGGLSELMQF